MKKSNPSIAYFAGSRYRNVLRDISGVYTRRRRGRPVAVEVTCFR